MPGRLSAIVQPEPVTYTARLGPESVSVTFDAARMTFRWERALNAARVAEDRDAVSDLILGVFIGWDVVDDAGQPVPLTQELLLDLPAKAVANLIEGMTVAAFPASEEGNVSGDTSSTPGMGSISSPESLQNGLPISPSPTPSTLPSQT